MNFNVKLPPLSKQSKSYSLQQCKAEVEALALEYFNEDLPSPSNFQQKLKLWKQYWANENEKPKSLSQTISVISKKQIGKIHEECS